MTDNVTRLGFIGYAKADIILYMARILYCLGEQVAIFDKSDLKELCLSVPALIYAEDMLDYRGVDVFLNCENKSMQALPVLNYSVHLIDFGINHRAIEDITSLKALFIITDMQRHHTVPLSCCIGRLPFYPDAVRIIRDVVPGKIRPRYIDSILQSGQFTNLIAKYELPLDESEYSQRLYTQYDDIFTFSNIPVSFKNMLLECITELFGFDKKSVTRAFKKAQRGG